MCMCNFVCKCRPRNDLYCVGQDVKPYSLTHINCYPPASWLTMWPSCWAALQLLLVCLSAYVSSTSLLNKVEGAAVSRIFLTGICKFLKGKIMGAQNFNFVLNYSNWMIFNSEFCIFWNKYSDRLKCRERDNCSTWCRLICLFWISMVPLCTVIDWRHLCAVVVNIHTCICTELMHTVPHMQRELYCLHNCRWPITFIACRVC